MAILGLLSIFLNFSSDKRQIKNADGSITETLSWSTWTCIGVGIVIVTIIIIGFCVFTDSKCCKGKVARELK